MVKWSDSENDKLLELILKYGTNFEEISQQLNINFNKNRSASACQSHYSKLKKENLVPSNVISSALSINTGYEIPEVLKKNEWGSK